MKFTDTAGSITIRSARQGERGEISVTDTGIGIPAEDLESIFEPFIQVGRSLTTGHEGTGLGLAISRSIVERHGGRLWLEPGAAGAPE